MELYYVQDTNICGLLEFSKEYGCQFKFIEINLKRDNGGQLKSHFFFPKKMLLVL